MYIYDDIEKKATGDAGQWWLNKTLHLHSKNLEQKFNVKLIITDGEAKKNLSQLIEKYKISSLIWNRLYSDQSIKRDTER